MIGTQLVAKGHNFPLLTLVGVVDADLGLAHGDLRAAERTFQLLAQVTGRAGRAGGAEPRASCRRGTRTIRSSARSSRATATRSTKRRSRSGARRGCRRSGGSRRWSCSGPDRAETQGYATALRRAAPADDAIEVLGPAEAPLAVVRGRTRFRLLVQAPRSADLQGFIRTWLAEGPVAHGALRVQVDIDPQWFL